MEEDPKIFIMLNELHSRICSRFCDECRKTPNQPPSEEALKILEDYKTLERLVETYLEYVEYHEYGYRYKQ